MKQGVVYLMLLIGSISSCQKQDAVERANAVDRSDASTDRGRLRPRFPIVPKLPLPMARCIYSYQDIVSLIGEERVVVSKVQLASGAIIERSQDLPYIAYQAVPPTLPNSLFDSKLIIEWRRPGGLFQGGTDIEPSKGCGPPPNLSQQGRGKTPGTQIL